MDQNIILSSDLFNYLDKKGYSLKSLLDSNSKIKRLMDELLSEESWIIEKNVWAENVKSIIDKAEHSDQLRMLFTNIPTKIFKVVQRNKLLVAGGKESLIQLANQHEDHIVVADFEQERAFIPKIVTALNYDEYINPPNDLPVIRLGKITLEDKVKFNLRVFFRKYLKETKTLTVFEPFIRDHQRQLIDIVSICKNLNEVQLFTKREKNYSEDETNMLLRKITEALKPHCVDVKFKVLSQDDLHDRSIISDRYVFDIGKGLGFVKWNRKINSYVVATGNNGYIHILAS